MIYEKTDKPGLYRDLESGAIINRDLVSLEAYKKKKRQAEMISSLQDDIKEIKQILSQLVNNNSIDKNGNDNKKDII